MKRDEVAWEEAVIERITTLGECKFEEALEEAYCEVKDNMVELLKQNTPCKTYEAFSGVLQKAYIEEIFNIASNILEVELEEEMIDNAGEDYMAHLEVESMLYDKYGY